MCKEVVYHTAYHFFVRLSSVQIISRGIFLRHSGNPIARTARGQQKSARQGASLPADIRGGRCVCM